MSLYWEYVGTAALFGFVAGVVAGLWLGNRKWCGMESSTAEFTSEYCEKCWRKALGDEI